MLEIINIWNCLLLCGRHLDRMPSACVGYVAKWGVGIRTWFGLFRLHDSLEILECKRVGKSVLIRLEKKGEESVIGFGPVNEQAHPSAFGIATCWPHPVEHLWQLIVTTNVDG